MKADKCNTEEVSYFLALVGMHIKGGVGLTSIMICELRDRQGTSPPEGFSDILRQFVAEVDQYREQVPEKEPDMCEKIMHDMVGHKVQ